MCAGFDRQLSWLNAVLALVVALGIQIGTNYVNDYADGVRGTDDARVGPVRLVAGELATVREVKIAALVAFGVAGVAGLVLGGHASPGGSSRWACSAGWPDGPTRAGPAPTATSGFGELFVFVFFGLVATAGSAYVQHAPFVISLGGHPFSYSYDWGFACGPACRSGLLAAALLQANNLRDIETDTESGKKTLAVRLGGGMPGLLYLRHPDGRGGFHRGPAPLSGVVAPGACSALPLAVLPIRLALGDRKGRELLPMLGATRASPDRDRGAADALGLLI